MPDQDLLEALKLGQDPGYEYGGVLPLKWPQGASGWEGMAGLRPAVPGFLRDQYNGLLSLVQDAGGAHVPGDNIDPEKLLALGGTGAIAGTMVPKNALGMFAGGMARGADLEINGAYDTARQLANKGADRNAIMDTTGWFKGRDNKWRYEISDDAAKLKLDKFNTTTGFSEPYYSVPWAGLLSKDPTKTRTLGDLLDHKELFDAYPHLKSMPVEPMPISHLFSTQGAYDPGNKKFYLNSGKPEDLHSTLLHEVQHAIQDHEGFAPGANINQFLPHDFAATAKPISDNLEIMRDKVRALDINSVTAEDVAKKLGSGETLGKHEVEIFNKLKNSGLLRDWQDALREYEPVRQAQKAATDHYYATHGEAEARNTEYRAGMTPFMRAQEKPWDTLQYMDHPQDESKLIVLGQDGKPKLAQQVEHDPFVGERSAQGKDLALQGRLGDSLVGHLTPGDAIIPAEIQNNPRVKQLLQEIYSITGTNPGRFIAGAQNKINPKTGLPEFEDAGGDGASGDGSGTSGPGGDSGGVSGGSNGNGSGAEGSSTDGSGTSGPGGEAAAAAEAGQGGAGPGGGSEGGFQPNMAAALPRLAPVQASAAAPAARLPPSMLTPIPTGLQPSDASPTNLPGTDLLNKLLAVAGSPLAQTNDFSLLNDLLKKQSGIYAGGA
jgi:hypothetical protein